MTTADILAHYTEPGRFTAAGPHLDALRALPRQVPELVGALQGLLIHEHLTRLYGVEHTPEHNRTSNIRPAAELLDVLLTGGPLTRPRAPSERLGGTCRHFTVLTVAALRAHGVPARARCGFGTYFAVPGNEDHWVAEYWNAAEARWILVDAQIDARQREVFGLDPGFDTFDVGRDRFVVAGLGWRRCRAGQDDPDRYGLSFTGESGAWWIAANLIRDTAALAGLEMLPWDVWGAIPEPDDELGPDLLALLDELAAHTAEPGTAHAVRDHYHHDDRLKVPEPGFGWGSTRFSP